MTDEISTSSAPATAPAPGGLSRTRTKWFALAALLIAGGAFAIITISGIGQNLVYYWGPTELKAAGDRAVGATIRLGGLVAEGSIRRSQAVSKLEFDVIDRKGGAVHVKASGVPPQLFRERIGVVVEGTMTRDGYFQGNRLMVSHSNEYRVPGEGQKADAKNLMRTTEGLEDEIQEVKGER
ncbi:MAG: cytochrome c maturation protein CcmE [Acidobacteriota bacterium]